MSRHRRWVELTIRIPPPRQELLSGIIGTIGFTGFLHTDHDLKAYLPSTRWTPSVRRKIHSTLHRFAMEFSERDLEVATKVIREENWNARWERSAGIVEATGKILIKPSWKKLRKQDRGKIVIHIDPKMSFGTGHHETTRLSLTLLQEAAIPGASVLDIGCGSGILSIAAAKLGARRVIGVDNDEWAWRNARENVKRNRAHNVRIIHGTLPDVPRGRFDLVLSNIDLPTNLKLLPALIRRMTPTGTLVLSGLLSSDAPRLLKALKGRRIVPLQCLEENEWIAISFTHANQRN